MKMTPNMTLNKQSAFSLVEVAMSLGITAFAMVAILGLVPIGVNSSQSAINQTAVANIATAIAADLRTTGKTDAATPRLGISLSGSSTYYFDESGGAARSLMPNSRYQVAVSVSPVPADQRQATKVGIVVTWPAAAKPANAAGMISTFIGLDRN